MEKTRCAIFALLAAVAFARAQAMDSSTKFTIDGSHGKLSAILRMPDGARSDAKYPVAVMCHGFGGDKCEHFGMFKDFADALAQRGVASVRFDFNGHGESEGAMRDMTVPNEIEDAKRVIEWVRKRPWCNGEVSLAGHSQGGVVAAMTAGELGSPAISRLVLLAPACVLKDDALAGCTLGSRYDPQNPPEVVKVGRNEVGRKFIKTAQKLKIFETARKFTGSVCLIHGTGDPIAKTAHVERLHKEYKNSEMHLMPGDDHVFSHTLKDVVQIVAGFIGKREEGRGKREEGRDGRAALDGATLKGVTDKAPCSYKKGEAIVFTFSLEGEGIQDAALNGLSLKWKRRGDDGVVEEGTMPLKRGGMKVKTSLAKPGFVHLEARVVDASGATVKRDGKTGARSCTGRDEVSFTGGAGVAIGELRQGVAEPKDFNARWKAALARLLREKPINRNTLASFMRDVGEGRHFECYEVAVPSYGPGWSDCRATAYLTLPKNAKPGSLKARVTFDGYGIYRQSRPGWCDNGWIDLHVNAHGLYPLEMSDGEFEAFKRDVIEARGGYGFNEEDNKDFEKAYFFGMAMRAVSATTFLCEYVKTRPEWDGKTLITTGGSQGGLQATWAAALVKGVSGLRIHVPWCCDLGGVDAGRMGGWRPRYTEALGYYDPVNLAKRLRSAQTKEIYRSALGDYVAPPCTHAVLYNAMRGLKSIEFRQGGDHYDDPEAYEQKQVFQAP